MSIKLSIVKSVKKFVKDLNEKNPYNILYYNLCKKYGEEFDLVALWILINISISMLSLYYYNSNSTNSSSIFYIILLFYSVWRLFGILVSVINIFLERLEEEFLKKEKERELRTFVLSIFNIFEIILWFALFYIIFNKHLFYCTSIVCPDSFINSLYFSIVTMAGLTYNEIIPKYSNIILIPFILQMLTGIFFIIIIISSFISTISTSNN